MPPAQPSFIPKKPITTGPVHGSSATLGIFIFFIAMLIFIASLVAAVAAFGYKGYLTSSIASKSNTLQQTEAAFDPSTIQDLMRLDSRMTNVESLLQKHTTTLALFNFLSQETLVNVQFTSFDYELQPDGSGQLTLDGVADSFSTIALQSDQFGASTALKDVVFSDIAVGTPTAGGPSSIKFTVKANIDPSLLSYAKSLSGSAPTLGTASSTTTTPTPAAPTLP